MAGMDSSQSYRVFVGPSSSFSRNNDQTYVMAGPSSSFAQNNDQSSARGNIYDLKNLDGLARQLKELFLSKQITDATIKVDEVEFLVHRAILGARSPVFCAMLKNNLAKKNFIVEITGSTKETCGDFLLYLYTGRVGDMNILKVLGLYTLSAKFDVAELKEICVQFMSHEMSVDKFCHVADLALLHKEPSLLENCTAFFLRNAERIATSRQWLPFVKTHAEAAIDFYNRALEFQSSGLKTV